MGLFVEVGVHHQRVPDLSRFDSQITQVITNFYALLLTLKLLRVYLVLDLFFISNLNRFEY